jgi:hypothetical protein
VPEIPDTVRIAGDAVDETSHPATSPHPVLCERMIDSLRSNPISMQRPHAKTSLNSCPQRLLAPQRPAHARSGLLNRACVSGPVDQAQRSFLISDISPQQQRTLVRVYSRDGSLPRRLARRPSLLTTKGTTATSVCGDSGSGSRRGTGQSRKDAFVQR